MDETPHKVAPRALSGAEFQRRFRWLIFHAWNIPPIFGLGFVLLIGVLTAEQILDILTTPLQPAYILGWLAFAMWFLPRTMRPLADWLDGRPGSSPDAAVRAVRRFPLVFWATFLVYLVVAPVSVIAAAHIYTDFVATPYALFRIELVALIVSIIVGLPIFFLIFDLFGQTLGRLELKQPIITVRAKVFLIGALVPMLIDTMLVQYYWTRTGFFTFETFGVWLLLELLAIAGSLIFAHSFGQSLGPLQTLLDSPRPLPAADVAALTARSTDELGLLTTDYRRLLAEMRHRNEILDLNNRLLRSAGSETGTAEIFAAVVDQCRQATGADLSFLIVHEPVSNTLVGVAQTDAEYRPQGHYRLSLDEQSLAVLAYAQGRTAVAADAPNDPRVSPKLCGHFGIRSAMATPLRVGDATLGVLMVAHTASRRDYDDRDRALIEGVARETALVVQTQQLRQAREQAEAGRLEQAERVRVLMDATEEGIYGSDTNGLCTFINRAAVRMLGYREPHELLGRRLHELIHHTHQDGRPYPVEQCRVRLATLAGEAAHADNEVNWRADGSSFPVEYWSRPIVRDGHVTGTVVSFVDITERRRAEEALRRSEREWSDAMDSFGDVLYVLDTNRRLQRANRAFFDMAGGRREELVGRHIASIVHPQGEPVPCPVCRAQEELRDAIITMEPDHPDNPSGRPIEVTVKILRNEEQEPSGILMSLHDLGHDRQAQARLAESEAGYRVLFETMAQGVVYQDRHGRITGANPAAERILGLSLDQMQGRTSVDPRWRAVHEDGAEFSGDTHPAMVALRTGRPVRDVVMGVFHAHENAYRWILVNAIPQFREGESTPFQVYATFADITERKRAEEAARVFQNLVDVAGQGIGMARLDSKLTYLNAALRRILAVGADEDVTRISFLDFYAQQDRAFLEQQVLPIVMERGSWVGEMPLRTATGGLVPTIQNIFLLRDTAGAPVALAGVLTDISEQQRAARALAESEARFRSIIEVSPVPMALNDDQLNVTYLNPAFVRTFGYTRDDIRTLADWWPHAYPDPDYRQSVSAEWMRRLERARERGSGFEPMEADIRAKDGTLRTVVASAASLGEAFAGTQLAILYDITALKRAEAALRASEDRLRTIVETEPECVKILDAEGRLLEMNPAGLAMIEADSLEQVKDRSVATIVSREQRAAFIELSRRVVEEGESGRLEFEIIGLKGTRRWLETNAVPLRDAATGAVRLLGVTRDITARKRAEAELQRYRDELEQRVKDRTAALERANKELEAFSYSVSHDLRAPLRAVDGFSRILLEDHAANLNAEARGHLDRVRHAVQRMGVLIDELLELSRVGRAEMRLTAVDLSQMAVEVVTQLRHGEPARAVEVDIAPGLRATGDARLLRLVLDNLLGNAWKYTARTEAARIAFGATKENGETVYRVTDNGAGFDMRYADKLFHPFQRLHRPQEFPGSGVGLATVARIINRHGGRVWAEGAPGQGATLSFTLSCE